MQLDVVRLALVVALALLLRPTLGFAQDDCAKVGGTWTRAPNWVSCNVALAPDKCRSRGGVVTANASPPPQYTCELKVALRARATACTQLGGRWGKFGSDLEYCHFEDDRRSCIEDGGSWERRGLGGLPRCIRVSRDGGKPCGDRTDCQYECLSAQLADSIPLHANVAGVCAPDNDRYKWRAVVRNNRLVPLPVAD